MIYKIDIALDTNINESDLLENNITHMESYKLQNPECTFIFYSTLHPRLTLMAITTFNFDKNNILEDEITHFLSTIPDIKYKNFFYHQILSLDLNRYIERVSFEEGYEGPHRQNKPHYLVSSSDLAPYAIETFSSSLRFEEKIVDDKPLHLSMEAESLLTLELERIAQHKQDKFMGHPVHYIIEASSFESASQACHCTIQNLHIAHRLLNKKLIIITLNQNRLHRNLFDISPMLHIAEGGSILFNLAENWDDNSMNQLTDIFEQITESIHRTQHRILYFFYVKPHTQEIIRHLDRLQLHYSKLEPTSITLNQARDYLAENYEHFVLSSAIVQDYLSKHEGKLALREMETIADNVLQLNLLNQYFTSYNNDPFDHVETSTTSSALEELDALIGLNHVKRMVHRIVESNHVKVRSRLAGHAFPVHSNHMVFIGNPGTAKTTVARLIGKIFKEENILSKGDFIELGRAELVERYVGWTAQHVQDIFKRAQGSVLFIDEAYSLLDGDYKGYGSEAIATILQEMENHREDMVVIFAGYPKEMKDFIDHNPGLRSRIKHFIDFPDYSTEELIEISRYIADHYNTTLDESSVDLLNDYLVDHEATCGLGNARTVRDIIEKAIDQHLINLAVEEDISETLTLIPGDFTFLSPWGQRDGERDVIETANVKLKS